MIEILTASIIGLLALTTFMFVRKLRKPNQWMKLNSRKSMSCVWDPFLGKAIRLKVSRLYL